MRKQMRRFNKGLAAIAATGMVAIVVLTSVDVITRKLDLTMGWPYEIVLLIFGWSVFLGLAFVESDRSHVGVDMFGGLLPRQVLRLRAIVMDTLALGVVSLLAFLAAQHTYRAYSNDERTNSLLALPVWALESALLVGMVAFAITIALELVNDFNPGWRPEGGENGDVASELV